MVEAELVVPYDKQGLLAEVYENARIIAEDYEEGSARLRVRGPPAAIAKLQRAFER
jgi:GTP-binding protein HflX